MVNAECGMMLIPITVRERVCLSS